MGGTPATSARRDSCGGGQFAVLLSGRGCARGTSWHKTTSRFRGAANHLSCVREPVVIANSPVVPRFDVSTLFIERYDATPGKHCMDSESGWRGSAKCPRQVLAF